MAIDAIGGIAPYAVGGASFASPREFRDAVVGSAAAALGLRAQNVTFAFANGMSLGDLARMRGIKKGDVIRAVAAGIHALEETTGGLPGGPNVLQMAVRIVDRAGGLSGARHASGIGAALNRAFEAAVEPVA